jgi:hypothetical protein
MTVPPQAPQPSTVPELLNALAALGAPAEVPAHLDDADAVLHLSHGLGAAEREATEADLAARAGGSDSPEILPAIEEAYAAANAQSRLGRARARAVAGHPAGAGPASLLADMSRDDPVLSTAIVATAGVSCCCRLKLRWPPAIGSARSIHFSATRRRRLRKIVPGLTNRWLLTALGSSRISAESTARRRVGRFVRRAVLRQSHTAGLAGGRGAACSWGRADHLPDCALSRPVHEICEHRARCSNAATSGCTTKRRTRSSP